MFREEEPPTGAVAWFDVTAEQDVTRAAPTWETGLFAQPKALREYPNTHTTVVEL